MTQDEIIEMTRQAGFTVDDECYIRFAKLVAAKEREACAMVCESLPTVSELRQLERATMKDCAHAIRAMGKK